MQVLPQYPSYKDSGVPWLGEIPNQWKVKRLKWITRLTYGDSLPSEVRRSGTVPVFGSNGIVGTHDAANTESDTIIIGRKGSFGQIQYSEKSAFVIDTAYYVDKRNTRSDLRWLYYVLTSLNLDSFTKDSAIPGLAREEAYTRLVPVCPNEDQQRIATFLDQKTAEIDEAISKKQRLIELLKEQKAILINQAVTKGPNPNVPMRDSGVDWIGEIPAHWEVRRNGRLFAQRNETGFADLPILEVSLRTGVRVRDFKNSDRKQLMSDRDKYKRAVSGDIAYNMMRMWQGAVGIAPTDGLISPAYVVAKPLPGTEARYFIHLFRTAAYMAEVDKYSRGIVKDRNRLYWEDFKRMPSCYPPPDEQVLISDAIDDTCDDIDMSAERIRRGIDLLREYRTRLISDVVTGKLDVREDAHSES